MAEKKQNRKKIEQRNRTRGRLVVALLFVLLIIASDISLIFSHSREFSARENRVLAQSPALTGAGLTSGRFMSDFESFVEDQMFLRDAWISAKLTMDRLLGRKESNGVYLAGDGYLIEKAKEPSERSFDRNIHAITQFAERNDIPVVMSLIPNAVTVLNDLLPAGAPAGDQKAEIREVSEQLSPYLDFADVTDVLMEHAGTDEQLYYRSDHHWTSLGAKYAFEALAPHLGLTQTVSEYTVMTVTDSFSGTLASSSGDTGVKDRIEIYVADTEQQYVVEYASENRKVASIYSSEAAVSSNQYEVFFGGNYPLINITTLKDNGRKLLLIKDSYANAFVQFLLPYYEAIYIVDPRYYSDDIDLLIKNNAVSDILILYNCNTFAEDNSIAAALEE